MVANRDNRAAAVNVFLFFLALYVLTLKGVSTGDEVLHYDLVQHVVASGRGDLPPGKYDPEKPGMSFFVARGTDGHVYLTLPNGLALASLPLGAVGMVADAWFSTETAVDPLSQPDEDGTRKAMAALRRRPSALLTASINPLVSALTITLFFTLAAQLAGSLRGAFQVALLLGLATVVWPYSTNYWTQPIAGFFLFASLYVSGRASGAVTWRRALGAGLLAGAAFLCRFETLPLSFWLLLYCVLSAPRTAARRWAAGLSFAPASDPRSPCKRSGICTDLAIGCRWGPGFSGGASSRETSSVFCPSTWQVPTAASSSIRRHSSSARWAWSGYFARHRRLGRLYWGCRPPPWCSTAPS